MALMSRSHGGGGINFPLSLETWIMSTVVALSSYFILVDNSGTVGWVEGTIIGLSFILAALGIRMGHGQYMTIPPLQYLGNITTPEKIDPFVSLLFGQDPKLSEEYKSLPKGSLARMRVVERYGEGKAAHRNRFGLAITGLAVLLGPLVAALSVGNFYLATLAFILGAGKSAAYDIGWWTDEKNGTEIGEWLRGCFLGIFVYMTLVTTFIH